MQRLPIFEVDSSKGKKKEGRKDVRLMVCIRNLAYLRVWTIDSGSIISLIMR